MLRLVPVARDVREQALVMSLCCCMLFLQTWKQLYLSFSRLQRMRWSVCRKEGTSSSLRALKSDNQEYEVDDRARFLLRYV